jgi:glycolate oxidase FAD binding subunit
MGGIIAANSFGPLRTRFGSVRDLIIGISVLRADGTRAKGGGKVVKTVAGFDVPKLMCGSRGTLAFIATATFRVHPVPEQTVTLRARGAAPVELLRRVRAQQLEPAAMVALGEGAGAWDVYLRFEGFGSGVRAQREKLRDLAEAEWPALSLASGPGRLRFGALPTQVEQVAKALAPLRPRIEWLPTLGLGFAGASALDPQAVQAARRELNALGGWLASEGDSGASLSPAELALHKAVKQQFDPGGILAPGRFIA